jgi:alpha-tubulin suppressor-like RCC1 family protein
MLGRRTLIAAGLLLTAVCVSATGGNAYGFGTGGYGNTTLTSGAYDTCAVLSNGTSDCWGWDNEGQLGSVPFNYHNYAPAEPSLPVAVPGVTDVTDLAAGADHTCASVAVGGVECWGANDVGQIGNGSDDNGAQSPPVIAPTYVPGVGGAIAAGDSWTCALGSDHTVQCWGSDQWGQLGNGIETTSEDSPVPVQGLAGAVQLTAGSEHTCALLESETVECWGDNQNDQLGTGAVVARHAR